MVGSGVYMTAGEMYVWRGVYMTAGETYGRGWCTQS